MREATPDDYILPVVNVDVYKGHMGRLPGRRQTWRWRAISAANGKKLASGEAYTNLSDLIATVNRLFGSGTTVFLRQGSESDLLLRRSDDAAPF